MYDATLWRKVVQVLFIVPFVGYFNILNSAEQPRIDVGQFLKLESHKYIKLKWQEHLPINCLPLVLPHTLNPKFPDTVITILRTHST